MSTGTPGPGQVERWIIIAIIIAACIAVLLVALQQFGITVPAFVIYIGWILVAAFVAVAAIKILSRML